MKIKLTRSGSSRKTNLKILIWNKVERAARSSKSAPKDRALGTKSEQRDPKAAVKTGDSAVSEDILRQRGRLTHLKIFLSTFRPKIINIILNSFDGNNFPRGLGWEKCS